MSIFSKIFGTNSAVKQGLDLVDNAFYTDQEKAENKKDMLKAYEPFKITQRLLALIWTLFSILLLSLATALHIMNFDDDAEFILDLMASYQIHYIALIILGFYFGGGFLNGIKK